MECKIFNKKISNQKLYQINLKGQSPKLNVLHLEENHQEYFHEHVVFYMAVGVTKCMTSTLLPIVFFSQLNLKGQSPKLTCITPRRKSSRRFS
jgi:hypothetical protein